MIGNNSTHWGLKTNKKCGKEAQPTQIPWILINKGLGSGVLALAAA
jgi:hypothetical protein